MRIGHKLIFGFVSIALLIGIVGYLAVHSSQKALQGSIGESSASLAVGALDSIDRNIYNRIEVFQEYSRDLMLQKTVLESNQRFEQLDNTEAYVNEKDQEWTSVPQEEITPFMQELIDNRLSKELREKTEFYEEKYGFRVFGEIFVTNKYGANAAQTGKTTDYRQDDEDWWQNAKKDGLYVADVDYDESADVYSTDIGIRIDDENRNFSGVIKVVLNIEEVINIIKEAEVTAKYKTTQFKLLTKDGKLIYSTEDFEFFEDVSHKLLSCFHQEEHLDYFITEGDKPGEGDELFAHAYSKGYKDYKGLGWTLVIEHRTEEIFAPVAKLRNRLIIISLAVAMLAIVLGLFISYSISGPLKKLGVATAEVGKGKLDTKIEFTSNDEISKLAQSFNKMTYNLKEFHANLEKKVQYRTSELKTANEQLMRENTERKKAEQMLEQKRNLLRAMVDTLHDEILAKDTNGTFVFNNLACSRKLGAESPSAVVGKTDFDFFPKEDAERDYATEQEIMRTGQPLINNEMPIYDEAGKITKWASSSKLPWRDGSGNIIGIVGINRDITKRKETEKALQDSESAARLAYEKLEKANRELKEMQSQIVQSEKLASIGQLAAGVAHEMNTPVGFVASNFQTLEDYIKKIQSLLEMDAELIGRIKTAQKTELLKKVDAISKSRDDMKMDFILEDIQGLFDDSREGLDRVTNIIQHLRDFSRIDQAGSLDEYNLNDGIEASLVVAKNEIKYDAELRTELSEVPPIFCNSGQINQVFLNILINAAQAIKSQERDDKGTITIRTYATDEDVVCEIADDGCGIPPDKISKVFDPFFTTKPVGKGTGLGLSVSYDIIVNKHKGEILVDSTVGKGAKFTIKLPIGKKKQNDKKEIEKNGKKNSIVCRR